MRFLLCFALASLTLLAGCFETNRSLSSPDESKVDAAFCGDWEIPNPDQPNDDAKVKLTIRNIDGKGYFVDWTEPKDKEGVEKTLRMVGWTAVVKGVTFAQLRDLPADGSIPDKHLVVRVELKGEQLKLHQLDDKFFKDRPMDTDADFKRLVEENLDNSEMYDEQEIVATKVAGK